MAMTTTTLKNLALVVALLAGGSSLAMIGFLAAQQIIARQASAPESAPTASTPANQLGQAGVSGTVAPSVASVQGAQSTSAAPEGPARTGPAEISLTTMRSF
jgi:hypothetical protein